MHDLRLIRDQFETLRSQLGPRGADVAWDDLRKFLEERRGLTMTLDDLRHQLRKGSDEVARLKREGQPADGLMTDLKSLGSRIKEVEEAQRTVENRVAELALRIPNVAHSSVPSGKDSAANNEMRRWGTIPLFSVTPKPHWEIGEALGILDFERAAKIAGSRFAILMGVGARLERALINYMLDLHTSRHGCHEVLTPFMVNPQALVGTGQLPKFEEDLFKLRDDDYYLIPTAEVPVTNLHRDEILAERDLPLRYASYTPCFRREAGSYGKDTRGLIRLHQFNKVELVTFAKPEDSYPELERLTTAAEAVLQGLSLPYRVVTLSTGDMGFAAAKTYDVEVWLPGQNLYREISSCSNFEAFQARRANIRYRRASDGKPDFVHTLNGSGLAVGRTLVAILENFQQPDGSVVIPPVLRPHMDGLERITKNIEGPHPGK